MLPILAVTQFLMTVDASVMNVSISALVEDLDTSVTAIQGVITAYTLVMAAGMITGGKIGDIVGRRRAMRLGLVIYALGSGLTAVAPNVFVLLIGWSLLEGIGAALIMPTVTALIAGNFTGRARAAAYGTIAAAAAVAIAVGPIVGGFVTAYASWRWVFAAEVVIAAGLFIGTRAIRDVAPEEHPSFDAVGAVLSALGLGLVVFAVLQSGAWGWVQPKVADGPDATPTWLGLSPVVWLMTGGLLLLWAFFEWERHRKEAGRAPLVDPALFANRRLTNGLWLLLLQYLVMMGVFFAMPLFLSIVLGLDAFDTGLRMLPLSLALVVTAPAVPKLLPNASPRRVVQVGLLVTLAATLLLAWRFEDGADASITVLPFLLMGVGMGALASQLGERDRVRRVRGALRRGGRAAVHRPEPRLVARHRARGGGRHRLAGEPRPEGRGGLHRARRLPETAGAGRAELRCPVRVRRAARGRARDHRHPAGAAGGDRRAQRRCASRCAAARHGGGERLRPAGAPAELAPTGKGADRRGRGSTGDRGVPGARPLSGP